MTKKNDGRKRKAEGRKLADEIAQKLAEADELIHDLTNLYDLDPVSGNGAAKGSKLDTDLSCLRYDLADVLKDFREIRDKFVYSGQYQDYVKGKAA